ncbi:hypothetical protein V6N12_031353 [Hibiscus sabdariffa]|uniref:Uncharacterized protein n=1 Tax=Hibiscus sabdariffa TaxID=183260 RepID=A0ABR2E952_9ROSI
MKLLLDFNKEVNATLTQSTKEGQRCGAPKVLEECYNFDLETITSVNIRIKEANNEAESAYADVEWERNITARNIEETKKIKEAINLYVARPRYKDDVLSLKVSHVSRASIEDFMVDPNEEQSPDIAAIAPLWERVFDVVDVIFKPRNDPLSFRLR